MKSRGYDTHYKQTPPPIGGFVVERAQLTTVARNKSKLPFNCDHCGIPFEKYACWAKRSTHHYCGRACANAARLVRIPKECVVCKAEMLLTPADYPRLSTCSKLCMRKRRTSTNINMRSSPDYRAIVNRLKKNAVCAVCETTKGPWIVRGTKLWVQDGLSCADGTDAYLVCRNCHLKATQPLAKASTYMTDRFKYYKERE